MLHMMNKWGRKNTVLLSMGYFCTNWSKALVFLNTTTCATNDISLSWLIIFVHSKFRLCV